MTDTKLAVNVEQFEAIQTALQVRYHDCLAKAEMHYQRGRFDDHDFWNMRARSAASACEALGIPY